MWSEETRWRLALEKKILELEMPQFRFVNPAHDTYVEGPVTPTLGSQVYQLKLELPSGYPDAKPSLIVSSPQVLKKYGDAGVLNSLGRCHEFHTDYEHPSGCVQICYTQGWCASMHLNAIFMRGMFWLEGYVAHLHTGESIATFVDREKEKAKDEH